MPEDREQAALDEIARTRVDRGVAWALLVAFLAVLGLPGAAHLALSPRPLGAAAAGLVRAPLPRLLAGDPLGASRETLARIDAFEAELRNGSPLARRVRPAVQAGMTRAFGAGNAQVQPGSDGTLYFRPSLRHLLGPPFLSRAFHRSRERSAPSWQEAPTADPRPAIRHFEEDLWRRGIELLVVPVPVKPSVDGSGLGIEPGLVNPSWAPFLADLERHGVGGVDPLEVMLGLPAPRYLATDTHWRPEAMEAVARAVAEALIRRGVVRGRRPALGAPQTISGSGDLASLLGVEGIAPDVVQTRPLASPPDPSEARVLLLGDSFSNIYADPALGFGAGAGFAEALTLYLGQAVRSIVINAGGALETRRALAERPELLDGIDVVVWEFTARELSFGDWRIVPIGGERGPADTRWLAAGSGPVEVSGTVSAIARAADPASAPYPDQVVALRVTLDRPVGAATDAWLYAWGMQDRRLAPASRLAPGDRVVFSAVAWSEAPDRARAASRGELSERPAAAPVLWVGE